MHVIMTLWQEYSSSITGPLWGEPPFPGVFHSQRTSDVRLWCFLLTATEELLNKMSRSRWLETSSRTCDVMAMLYVWRQLSFFQVCYNTWRQPLVATPTMPIFRQTLKCVRKRGGEDQHVARKWKWKRNPGLWQQRKSLRKETWGFLVNDWLRRIGDSVSKSMSLHKTMVLPMRHQWRYHSLTQKCWSTFSHIIHSKINDLRHLSLLKNPMITD